MQALALAAALMDEWTCHAWSTAAQLLVLHGESNKGLASPRTTKTVAQSKPPTNQATTKQSTNNTINLCTDHPTHHTHQPALHPDEHTIASHNAPTQFRSCDPCSSKPTTKCPQQHSNDIAHTDAGTSNPQPSRHSLYAAQAYAEHSPKAYMLQKANEQGTPPPPLYRERTAGARRPGERRGGGRGGEQCQQCATNTSEGAQTGRG